MLLVCGVLQSVQGMHGTRSTMRYQIVMTPLPAQSERRGSAALRDPACQRTPAHAELAADRDQRRPLPSRGRGAHTPPSLAGLVECMSL